MKLSRFVTVGLGSMVGINVEAGEKCQIGAMSVVLKGTRLDAESVYVGVPVRKVERNSPAAVVETALLRRTELLTLNSTFELLEPLNR